MSLTFEEANDKMRPMFRRTAQRGFIFFELMIGLPLILMLMWAMAHLFVGTWRICRDLIADLTLQTEVQEAMQMIVSDLRVASHVELPNGKLQINSYLHKSSNERIYESDQIYENSDPNKLPIYYFHDSTTKNGKTYTAIYRQRSVDEKDHPITGEDIMSDVNVISFRRAQLEPRLWEIAIEAESRVSGHKIRLETKVYVGGADR